MSTTPMLQILSFGSAPLGRWRLWAFLSAMTLVAAIGTWMSGQYQIGRLDSLKNKYSEPVQNYARMLGNAAPRSIEKDLLEGCKQAQIGTWLQTTDALRFDGPLTGNRVDVRLDPSKAYLDLNGREMAGCMQDEVEERQFDIGSMTNTWAVFLMLGSLCFGVWAAACFYGSRRSRNIYAETLEDNLRTESREQSPLDKNPPDETA